MNTDNFIGDRPSTRVRAPPGGSSSFSLGWDASAAAPAAAAARPRAEPAAVSAPVAVERAPAEPSYPSKASGEPASGMSAARRAKRVLTVGS